MIDRTTFDTEIEKLTDIAQKYKTDSFTMSIQQLNEIKTDFDVKIMMVGHFNAGKSALINATIGRQNFLKENQAPETAIAAELHYGKEESVFGVDEKGNRHEITGNQICTDHFSHIEYYIDSPVLNKLSDYTIVDTPGFDSGIEAHNKALTSYLAFAAAYIVVIDADKGGIDKITLGFINEISRYSNMITVLLNKCDKQTKENAEIIRASAEQTLKTYGYYIPVYCISKYDPDAADTIFNIVSDFNAQHIYNMKLGNKIRTETENAVSVLQLIRKMKNCSTYDIDVNIQNYVRAKEKLQQDFDTRRNEYEDKANNFTENILNELRAALADKSNAVADAALCGGSAGMEAVISETIRPVLYRELKRFSFEEIDSIAAMVDFSHILDSASSKGISEIIVNLACDSKEIIDSGAFGKIADEISKTDKETKKTTSIYHIIGSAAAIATNVISPWLEAIIIVLPDIFQLLGKLFGESDREKIIRQYNNSIIPQVTNKLFDPIMNAVNESCHTILDNMQSAIESSMDSINSLLKEASEKRVAVIDEYDAFMKEIDKDITELNQMLNRKDC